ncbi:MAG: doubled motif LPXTG anchor domain-containing protein [Oscillospiraceae bacterium]|nr:doubled motif LPXTG anchor domain-containing protein [Oscillospiraceae bacterium]
MENKEIPALGHECGDFRWDNAQHWSECNRCYEAIGGKKDHEWKEVSREEATCTEPGEIKYECGVPNCNASCDEEILSKGHSTEIVVENEPTCTEKGNEHEVCTVCGVIVENKEIPALGHECGSFQWDDVEHWSECARCHQVIGEKKDHEWKEASRKDPTCTEPGEIKYECSVPNCNASYDEEIPSKGHFTTIVVDNEPTCTEKGNEHEECTVCGSIVESKEIPALGHELEPILQGATCTDPGLTGVKCTRPGCGYRAEVSADAIGHDYKIIEQIEGDSENHLLICGNDTSHTQQKAHAYGAWETVRAATATEDGEEQHVCAGCGYVQTRPIQATGSGDDGNTQPSPIIPDGDDDGDDTPPSPVIPDGDDDDGDDTQPSPVIPDGDDDDGDDTQPSPATPDGDATTPGTGVPMTDAPEVTIPDADVPLADVPEVTVPDADVPLADVPEVTVPDEEVPLADIPEVEIPEEEVPLANIPEVDILDGEVPLVDIPDENIPLADVPKTGDLSYIWGILTLISGACMAWLALEEKKRTEK